MPYLCPFIQGYFCISVRLYKVIFIFFVRLYKICTLFLNHDIMSAKSLACKGADFAECIEERSFDNEQQTKQLHPGFYACILR